MRCLQPLGWYSVCGNQLQNPLRKDLTLCIILRDITVPLLGWYNQLSTTVGSRAFTHLSDKLQVRQHFVPGGNHLGSE